ncbi:MAG: 3',5'-cyclic-nucleotide phosphodiesterase [Campylobacterota bacterium]|nr:3',5'-cyclic-nucleotide phosphodiesterase [Campylobacterota bacterium]
MPNSLFYSDKTPFIKVLGAYGGKATNMQLSSLQLSKETVLDAGNLVEGLGNGIKNVNHIFVTHSHLDHILDIGFLIDATFNIRTIPLKVYGRKKTLENIKKHILNWEIWPDFTQIDLIDSNLKAIELIDIELNETIEVDGCKIKAIENNHTTSSNGYVIEKEDSAILFTSDTYCCDGIWNEVNNNSKISTVIVDVSFPSKLDQLALDSKHLTPKLLKEELTKLKRDDVTIHINHIKPFCKNEVVEEIIKNDLLLNNGAILEAQDVVEF